MKIFRNGLPLLKGKHLVFALLAFVFSNVAYGQYCLPTYANPCSSNDFIDRVDYLTINNGLTGCGVPGINNYTDYTSTISATVVAGSTDSISCWPGAQWGQYFVAAIDLNQDSDFADPGEFFDIGYAAAAGMVSNMITIPCNAMAGTTRLRVMCQFGTTQLTQADICSTTLNYGEVEDYTLVIVQPTYTDAKMLDFVTPVTACGMGSTEQVQVRIVNSGGVTLTSYTACYTVNNGAPVCETVTMNVLPCDTVIHTFATPANLSATGQYDLDAWVTVASDSVPSNDTLYNVLVDNIPVISTLPYSENFESSNGGFTGLGTSSSWEWGIPTGTFINAAASPTNAWVTDLDSIHNDNEISFLLSPCFDFSGLSADPFVSFSHIFETDGFGDRDFVEVSTDAGVTWAKLGAFGTGNNWYTDQFNDWWSGTSGNAGQWQTADHVMTGTAGFSSVRFRIAFESDNFTTLEGVGIDNIRVLDTIINAGVSAILAPSNGCLLSATDTVAIEITNYGTHDLSGFQACFSVNGGPSTCENIAGPVPAGSSINYSFTGTANLGAVGAYNVAAYTIVNRDSISDNDTTYKTVTSFPVVNTFPYVEDFEGGAADWAAGGNSTVDWALGTPNKLTIIGAASGSNAWVTADTGQTSYEANADTWVESPCYDLTSMTNPWVASNVWWNSEFSWDGVALESSTDGGNTWVEIGLFGDPYNWYTDNTVQGLTNAGGSGNGWSGRTSSSNGSNGYVFAKHNLAALAGLPNIRFRMHFGSDGSVQDDGFAFDDFIVANGPQVDLGNDTVICVNYLLDPALPAAGDFQWSTGDSSSTLMVTTAGTYSLIYTDSLGICEMDTIVLSQTPTPPINLGGDQNICMGATNCLVVDTMMYLNPVWNTGATTGQICVSTAGTYSVVVADSFGCVSGDTISTAVVPLPSPFLGADTTVCPGDTVCLNPNCDPSNSYIWSNGSTSAINCVTIVSGYWVICIDSNGCEGADSIFVNAATPPTASAVADTAGCPIVDFTSTSTGGATSFEWDFGDGNTSTGATPSNDYTAAGNGTYTVTMIASNGCFSDTTTLSVTVGCLVSIGNDLDNQVKLFPNPNKGKFMLETVLTGTAPVSVTIVDVHGKLVFSREYGQIAGNFSEEITLDEQTKGIYFVKLNVGGKTQVKKIVVQ